MHNSLEQGKDQVSAAHGPTCAAHVSGAASVMSEQEATARSLHPSGRPVRSTWEGIAIPGGLGIGQGGNNVQSAEDERKSRA